MIPDEPRAACVGMSWMFESVHAADHDNAAAICRTCPMAVACAKDTAKTLRGPYGLGVHGTWAGTLYDGGHRVTAHRGPRARAGDCPRCGALDGVACLSPNGIRIGADHQARTSTRATRACKMCGTDYPRRHNSCYCSPDCAEQGRVNTKRRYDAKRERYGAA